MVKNLHIYRLTVKMLAICGQLTFKTHRDPLRPKTLSLLESVAREKFFRFEFSTSSSKREFLVIELLCLCLRKNTVRKKSTDSIGLRKYTGGELPPWNWIFINRTLKTNGLARFDYQRCSKKLNTTKLILFFFCETKYSWIATSHLKIWSKDPKVRTPAAT